MHDWTLVSVQVDWQAATVVIVFRNADSELVLLTADGFKEGMLMISRLVS